MSPFDDCGNENIQYKDISTALLRDYFVAIDSSLANRGLSGDNLQDVLEQMDLLEHPPEGYRIKNVAAMMFSEHPEQFFKQLQVDIVIFPEGREQNPNLMIEVPAIKGNIPKIIRETLDYLKTNVITRQITKPNHDAKAIHTYNYPYQALEEAVVNALFHRCYQLREPVEITIEPDKISILSFAGPNHTISMNAIREAKSLRSRSYTNRRLGEFLKELHLTEGRATGIPTIQEELKKNGSPRIVIDTDEERTYFLIDIPCREDMVRKIHLKTVTKTVTIILAQIKENKYVTLAELAIKCNITKNAVYLATKKLQKANKIRRVGSNRNGYWEIIS